MGTKLPGPLRSAPWVPVPSERAGEHLGPSWLKNKPVPTCPQPLSGWVRQEVREGLEAPTGNLGSCWPALPDNSVGRRLQAQCERGSARSCGCGAQTPEPMPRASPGGRFRPDSVEGERPGEEKPHLRFVCHCFSSVPAPGRHLALIQSLQELLLRSRLPWGRSVFCQAAHEHWTEIEVLGPESQCPALLPG